MAIKRKKYSSGGPAINELVASEWGVEGGSSGTGLSGAKMAMGNQARRAKTSGKKQVAAKKKGKK